MTDAGAAGRRTDSFNFNYAPLPPSTIPLSPLTCISCPASSLYRNYPLRERSTNFGLVFEFWGRPLLSSSSNQCPSAAVLYYYRAEKKSLQILLSSTQAGSGRKVKQEQEEISRNHVPRLFLGSVLGPAMITGHSFTDTANQDNLQMLFAEEGNMITDKHCN